MPSSSPREQGSTLIVSLLLIILLFGLASSIGILADTRSKSIRDELRQSEAFYLAEGGLEHAMWELEVEVDLGQDGIGALERSAGVGEQSVTTTDLGEGLYEVLSTGTCEGSEVVLRGLIRRVPLTRFNQGAISVVGTADKTKVHFKKHLGLSIDGGDTAGITLTDSGLFAAIADEVVDAIDAGFITDTSIRGDVWTDHGADGDSSPISMSYATGGLQVSDLEKFYDSANAAVVALVSTAQLQGEILGSGTDTLVYGSAENPEVVHFDGKVTLKQGDSITGFGTLIISNEVRLSNFAQINWTGDIIVFADASKAAKMIFDHDSDLVVDGNLAVLGEGLQDVEFKVASDASVRVNGAATLGTYQDSTKGKKVKLEVSGDLRVDGLFSLVGAKVELNLKDGSNTDINGMLQIGVIDPDDKLSLKFDGNLTIKKDDEQILAGAQALFELGATLDIAEISELIYLGTVEDLTWGKVH